MLPPGSLPRAHREPPRARKQPLQWRRHHHGRHHRWLRRRHLRQKCWRRSQGCLRRREWHILRRRRHHRLARKWRTPRCQRRTSASQRRRLRLPWSSQLLCPASIPASLHMQAQTRAAPPRGLRSCLRHHRRRRGLASSLSWRSRQALTCRLSRLRCRPWRRPLRRERHQPCRAARQIRRSWSLCRLLLSSTLRRQCGKRRRSRLLRRRRQRCRSCQRRRRWQKQILAGLSC
mmetsp:Transcript_3662/g.10661  ORF Transcript_3662/g.10661 Transcript_3662/m.10661 type:complete len:232 (-) Transcript_3662:22-717(-)